MGLGSQDGELWENREDRRQMLSFRALASSQQQAGHRVEGRHPINSLLIWKQTEEGWTSLLLLVPRLEINTGETATVCQTLTTAGIGRFLQLPSLLFFFPSSPFSTQPLSFPEGSHIAQASLQLLNSQSSCFDLLDSGITVCPTMPVFCSELPSLIFGPGGQEKMWGGFLHASQAL